MSTVSLNQPQQIVNCPGCGTHLALTARVAGKKCQCRHCHSMLLMPAMGVPTTTSIQVQSNKQPGLYTAQQLFAATFVSGLMAGGTLLALNLARLGKRLQAWAALAGSVIATVVIFALLFLFSSSIGQLGYIVVIGQALVLAIIGEKLMSEELRTQAASGAKSANRLGEASLVVFGWMAFWIALYFVLKANL